MTPLCASLSLTGSKTMQTICCKSAAKFLLIRFLHLQSFLDFSTICASATMHFFLCYSELLLMQHQYLGLRLVVFVFNQSPIYTIYYLFVLFTCSCIDFTDQQFNLFHLFRIVCILNTFISGSNLF